MKFFGNYLSVFVLRQQQNQTKMGTISSCSEAVKKWCYSPNRKVEMKVLKGVIGTFFVRYTV